MHTPNDGPVEFARRLRIHTLRMVHKARAAHVGSCLSIADLLAHLYGGVLRIDPAKPDWSERDRFILSKGHAAAIVYAALAERGFFPLSDLDRYCDDGSPLAGHLTHHGVPGVDASTGSLGHGLSIACGLALAAQRANARFRVFAVLSDGELNEGSIWEAVLFAPHHRLENLVVIVDYNKIQSLGRVEEVLDLEPLADKWRAFGWSVLEIDGHAHDEIASAFATIPRVAGRPTCIIAHTVKGKGVHYMEDQLAWHYRSPDSEQLKAAIREVEARP